MFFCDSQCRRKIGRGFQLGELPEIWDLPFNISATAENSDFKFGTQLGFAKAHQKSHPEEKVGVPWDREIP